MPYPLKSRAQTFIECKQFKFLLPLLLILSCSNLLRAQCSKAGSNNASTFANDNSTGVNNFDVPSRAQLPDAMVASGNVFISLFGSGSTRYLKATGFNFTIPPTATICGIQVEIEKSVSALIAFENIVDNSVRLVKGGAITGDDKASNANGLFFRLMNHMEEVQICGD